MTAPTLPRLTEAQFQRQVTEFAELRGWEWFHVRPGRTADSWRTPTSGTMAKGWPDLVLVRGRRLIFAELKRDGQWVTDAQRDVLDALGWFTVAQQPPAHPWEVHCWTPKDWDYIEARLR